MKPLLLLIIFVIATLTFADRRSDRPNRDRNPERDDGFRPDRNNEGYRPDRNNEGYRPDRNPDRESGYGRPTGSDGFGGRPTGSDGYGGNRRPGSGGPGQGSSRRPSINELREAFEKVEQVMRDAPSGNVDETRFGGFVGGLTSVGRGFCNMLNMFGGYGYGPGYGHGWGSGYRPGYGYGDGYGK